MSSAAGVSSESMSGAHVAIPISSAALLVAYHVFAWLAYKRFLPFELNLNRATAHLHEWSASLVSASDPTSPIYGPNVLTTAAQSAGFRAAITSSIAFAALSLLGSGSAQQLTNTSGTRVLVLSGLLFGAFVSFVFSMRMFTEANFVAMAPPLTAAGRDKLSRMWRAAARDRDERLTFGERADGNTPEAWGGLRWDFSAGDELVEWELTRRAQRDNVRLPVDLPLVADEDVHGTGSVMSEDSEASAIADADPSAGDSIADLERFNCHQALTALLLSANFHGVLGVRLFFLSILIVLWLGNIWALMVGTVVSVLWWAYADFKAD